MKLLGLILLLTSSSQAQEYIGVKTTNKGDCRLYRERFIVDSGKFSNDLKKQVSYREQLILAGKEKVSALALSYVSSVTDQTETEIRKNKKSNSESNFNSKTKIISNSMVAVEQVEDGVDGANLIWAFEYCVYDKPVDDLDQDVVGTTGLAQKVFGNPDGTYTIEYPRILHAGESYYLQDPSNYLTSWDTNILGNSLKPKYLRNICKRFGFKKYISHTSVGTQGSNTVKMNKSGIVRTAEKQGHATILKQITCN
ncbi:MAG: hypothetical protein KA715_08325 [Xanthomonadaceae bacterium]|nr:hypothetical protein [Xanthomonadaceae bacterium]